MLALPLLAVPARKASGQSTPALVIREIDITDDSEMIVLQATSDIKDLSTYWIGYNSSDTAHNLVPTQQLPYLPRTLKAGEAILLTSGNSETCDAVYSAKLSFSLGNSMGTAEVRHLTIDPVHNTATFTTEDKVSWKNPTSKDPIGSIDNINLDNEDSSASSNVWYHDPGNFSSAWQVGALSNCTITFTAVSSGTGGGTPLIINWPQASVEPPATIISQNTSAAQANTPQIPASDIGLIPPIVNELLPNPGSPKSDASDEFIELYNPNSSSFDLSGFTLQTGSTASTRRHNYVFPKGTLLSPKSFKAFYSSQTQLSLSNSGGQVWLMDPLGRIISKSGAYDSAKDNQAWALAKGNWYWTTSPTPNLANVIKEPVSKSSASKTATINGTKVTAVKGASTLGGASNSALGGNASAAAATPVHPWTLAAVAALALLYGAYEYRHDLGNHIYKFRKYYQARRSNR